MSPAERYAVVPDEKTVSFYFSSFFLRSSNTIKFVLANGTIIVFFLACADISKR